MAAPGVEVGRVRLNILPAFCQSMRVEHKLVWGEENAGITQFLVELVILRIRPAERALDALCTRGIVASWHKLAAATPGTSGFALFIKSARAFTGRRNSHSGRGEDFLTGQPNFFTETAVTPERKVEKWFPRWEINRHAEG